MSDRDWHGARRHDLLGLRDVAERLRRDADRVKRGRIPSVSVRTILAAVVDDLASLVGETAVIYLFPGTSTSPVDGGRTLELDIAQRQAFGECAGDYARDGYRLFGISSQSSEELHEAADRHLDLSHDLLSDESLGLAEALGLPTFTVGTSRAYHRLAIVVEHHEVQAAFPADHPRQVDAWLRMYR